MKNKVHPLKDDYHRYEAELSARIKPVRTLPVTKAKAKRLTRSAIAGMIGRVQQNERKLIGRELHDNVNQILSTVKLFIEMMEPATCNEKKIKDKSIDYLLLAIEEIRGISRELVAPGKKNEKLADSIRTIIADIQFATPLRIDFNYNPVIEFLKPDRKNALLRIVQEQLKNIIGYSKAEQVVINIDIRNGVVFLEISDNGVGFDVAQTTPGIGLSNIFERATYFKGSVDIKTAKGEGCVLLISLPAA